MHFATFSSRSLVRTFEVLNWWPHKPKAEGQWIPLQLHDKFFLSLYSSMKWKPTFIQSCKCNWWHWYRLGYFSLHLLISPIEPTQQIYSESHYQSSSSSCHLSLYHPPFIGLDNIKLHGNTNGKDKT